MIFLKNDYGLGAHPRILKALEDANSGSLTPKIRKRARKRCKRLIFLSNFWFLYCVF